MVLLEVVSVPVHKDRASHHEVDMKRSPNRYALPQNSFVGRNSDLAAYHGACRIDTTGQFSQSIPDVSSVVIV